MRLLKYDQILPRDQDLILKLNLSWTKYFPACSSQPWQVEGVGRNSLHLPTVKCVHPDTEILLADGSLVRAEALVKERQVREPSRSYSDGDRVSEGEVRVVSLRPAGLGGAQATQFWRTPVR